MGDPFCMALAAHEPGNLRKDKAARLPPESSREYFFGLSLTSQCQGAQWAHERIVLRLCLCTKDFVPNILCHPMKPIVHLVAVLLTLCQFFLSGCGKGNEPSQLGTTTPETSAEQITQSEAGNIGEQEQAYQNAKDEALAASEKEYEARMHGAPPRPSEFPFPNPPGEQPIPNYINFYSINDRYPTYLLCEYRVDKREYDQLDEPKWFKAALKQIRQSGPKKFPPITWIAVIIINRAEWNGASTFEEAHKVGTFQSQ